ncbi:hypothetical protein K1T71_005639 [Dendrolimus kikuchii]|uniref:Uncharacterized protein n=1 Tax=Dendrolimus kikuchii TaxID=765133 RepID=A0ACC1D4K1_9NEOP|nr:hypothetical protein K1T71_005639 [Dendrolimus kikuchii]
MDISRNNVLICLILSFITWKTVHCINCYQCSGTDSENPFECNEFLDSDVSLIPTDCATIHEAQYCIKHVGRFEGGIGTKRYCSSLDLGTYCNYVQQPGDKLQYRSCIYTCNSDGCNSAYGLRISGILLAMSLFLRLLAF